LNVLDAICAITVSWERITLETIAACFRHIGFHSDPISAEEYHRPQELQEPEGWSSVTEKLDVTCSFAEYIAADEIVDVCSEMTDTDLTDLVTNEDIHSENEEQNKRG
jgi:hypothetical protein